MSTFLGMHDIQTLTGKKVPGYLVVPYLTLFRMWYSGTSLHKTYPLTNVGRFSVKTDGRPDGPLTVQSEVVGKNYRK